MRTLILGAGGVFGTNLARYLLARGHEVQGIGRSPRKPECFSLGVKYPYFAYHIAFELDYILERVKAFKPEVIVNFAAQGEGAASWGRDNWRYYNTNCTALVKLVANLSCRFIQIGSSEVYGSVDKPVSEDSLLNPTSPYSVSKAAFDLHLIAMHKIKGMEMNIIRPSNCYGPGQQLHRIIPKTLLCAISGRRLRLDGGGKARKSYLHTEDLSGAIEIVMRFGKNGGIYNVGPKDPTSIRDVVRMCLEAVDKDWSLVEEGPERLGQDGTYWLDSGKIKALGWSQAIDWYTGLKTMVEWIHKYPELLEMPTEFSMRA